MSKLKIQNSKTNPHQSLKLIPLGGVGDVTKNMYVYEYGGDIIIVDCGVGFPTEMMLGIDLVIPDISYLRDKKEKIRGIIITHGHEDHIGGLPYIWPELDVPIYSQKLTCGLIRAKFLEHNLPKDKIKVVGISDTLSLGAFRVSFYQVSHSVPDSVGIVIKSPVGTIIHQADFKIDWTPVNNQKTDVGRLAKLGEEGVSMMLIDCLRIEKQGYTLSEKTIEPTFEKVVRETEGKVLITMTSSNITRMQQALNVASRLGRKVVLSGRSMEGNFQVARDLGYLDVASGLVIPQQEVKRFPDKNLLILIAGAFGQPGSSLSRAANHDHKYIFLKRNDSVIFSADPIPSTETAQYSLIDSLTKLGCRVYYSVMTSDLHVSGHAAQEEIKLMLNLAKPKYLLGIGGTFRHMEVFSQVAAELGYSEDQIIGAEDGSIIEIAKNHAKITGRVGVSNVYVDGYGIGDVGNIVLRDRRVLSEDGIVLVVVAYDKQKGMIVGEPDIISRGFVYEKQSEGLLSAGVEIVKSCLRNRPEGIFDWHFTKFHIEENLEKFFFEETQRRPMIVSVLVDL